MKLLIITQKVDINDDLLGIYHEWIKKLAQKVDYISVICLYKGRYELPQNVKVYSLGKEVRVSRLIYLFNFYKYIWKFRSDYDTVFVHMNPEYIVLGGLFWKITGKKIVLWYAHYLSNLKLRLAMIFADKIITSMRLAFPLKSVKLEVLQQGIDINKFSPSNRNPNDDILNILYLGRISPVKNLETLLIAASKIRGNGINFHLDIIGEPTNNDHKYSEKIKKLAETLNLQDCVSFLGKLKNSDTPVAYNKHDLFVNLTCSGSFDKTILEAMSCSLPILVSNRAYEEILGDLKEWLMFKENDPEDLADKIECFINLTVDKKNKIKKTLREIVIDKHSLDDLIDKLAHSFET